MGLIDFKAMSSFGRIIDDSVVFTKVPTGSIALDIITGGGLGGMVEIYGAFSTGKCVTGDTLVATDKGIRTLEFLYEYNGGTYINEEFVGHVKALQPVDGGYAMGNAKVYYDGEKDVVKIKLTNDIILSGSNIHKVKNSDGDWIELQNIKMGDTIQFGYGCLIGMDFPQSKFYGLLPLITMIKFGNKSVKDFVYIDEKNEKLIIDAGIFSKYIAKGVESLEKYLSFCSNNPVTLSLVSKRWGKWIVDGIDDADTLQEYIESAINNTSILDNILYDCQSVYDLSAMLRIMPSFDIDEKTMNTLRIVLSMMGLLFIRMPLTKNRLLLLDSLKYSLMSGICNETVVDISKGHEKIFDLSFESDNHEYVANGLITHNTTLAMSMARNACALGIPCMYIETEFSMKPTIFETYGLTEFIDVDMFLPIRMASALEISQCCKAFLTSLMKRGYKGPVGLFLDSVGSINTTIEKLDDVFSDNENQGMNNNQIGQQSKVIQALYLELHKSFLDAGGFVVSINHARDSLNMGWGAAKAGVGTIKSPGGHAYHHLLHNQLVLFAGKKIKEGGADAKSDSDVIGQVVKGTLTKTKDGNQWKSAAFTIDMRNGGVDNYHDILEIASSVNYYTVRGGNWVLNFADENGEVIEYKGSGGTDGAKLKLKTDPNLMRQLRSAILREYGVPDLIPYENVMPDVGDVDEDAITAKKTRKGRPTK